MTSWAVGLPAVPRVMRMIMIVVMHMRRMFVLTLVVLTLHGARLQSAPISTFTCSPTLRASAPKE